MFSVIIPTMWKSEKTKQLVNSLVDCDLVGEVIIIDNNPGWQQIKAKRKTFIMEMETNIYVNRAWNMGVKLSKYKNIAILNDDILIDTNVFLFLKDKLADCGIVGMCWENYNLKQSTNMILTDILERPYGYGCAMFINKDNYVKIPSELKIACGDDYLIKFAKGKAKKLLGCKIESEISETSRLPEFGLIQADDNRIYTEKYK